MLPKDNGTLKSLYDRVVSRLNISITLNDTFKVPFYKGQSEASYPPYNEKRTLEFSL